MGEKIGRIGLFSTLFLLVGCFGVNLSKYYKGMEVGPNEINGYTLDLRIYGKY